MVRDHSLDKHGLAHASSRVELQNPLSILGGQNIFESFFYVRTRIVSNAAVELLQEEDTRVVSGHYFQKRTLNPGGSDALQIRLYLLDKGMAQRKIVSFVGLLILLLKIGQRFR